jgi:hypothetical protein
MFTGATSFSQDLSSWVLVGGVCSGMFSNCPLMCSTPSYLPNVEGVDIGDHGCVDVSSMVIEALVYDYIYIPIYFEYGCSVRVDWGDGNSDEYSDYTDGISHEYSNTYGIFNNYVKITITDLNGNFTGRLNYTDSNWNPRVKSIVLWGTLEFNQLSHSF